MPAQKATTKEVGVPTLIAQSLKRLGVHHVFGIVGIPVIEVAEACANEGLVFISFRNEQAAVYAASAYGFLTGTPGVALVVGGPGLIHALAGADNANANRWPLLLLAGSSETSQRGMGGFQQLDQVSVMHTFGKFAEQPASAAQLPSLLEQAYRHANYGRPGATYIDLPANIIQSRFNLANLEVAIKPPGAAPKSAGDPARIKKVADLLRNARFPLLIIGKGAAYSRAEKALRAFQSKTKIAFLPTPMGKGVVPDSAAENVASARSAALKNADVCLVVGARLNWILHYGRVPKFAPDVQIAQIDNVAEELGHSTADPALGILGDAGLVTEQLSKELGDWSAPKLPNAVLSSREKNEKRAHLTEKVDTLPLSYEAVYKSIKTALARVVSPGRRIVYVSEGANTMDISRSAFPLESPRTRLDAGTNATMGVGLGYAIAAKISDPGSLVVALEGDSAFGFSAMEVDTAVRHSLPMVIFVLNNSGVYHGVDPSRYNGNEPLPPTALGLNTAYHTVAKGLGARGYLVSTPEQIESATAEAVASNEVAVINVLIASGQEKKLEFGWMASAKI